VLFRSVEAGRGDDPALAAAFAAGERLRALAAGLDTTPAALAIAYALRHPAVASALLGATSPAQVAENVAALDVAARLETDAEAAARLLEVGR